MVDSSHVMGVVADKNWLTFKLHLRPYTLHPLSLG